MATQLENANNKLSRLKEEEKELMKAIRKEHDSVIRLKYRLSKSLATKKEK